MESCPVPNINNSDLGLNLSVFDEALQSRSPGCLLTPLLLHTAPHRPLTVSGSVPVRPSLRLLHWSLAGHLVLSETLGYHLSRSFAVISGGSAVLTSRLSGCGLGQASDLHPVAAGEVCAVGVASKPSHGAGGFVCSTTRGEWGPLVPWWRVEGETPGVWWERWDWFSGPG